jgi:hypothetical protein
MRMRANNGVEPKALTDVFVGGRWNTKVCSSNNDALSGRALDFGGPNYRRATPATHCHAMRAGEQ